MRTLSNHRRPWVRWLRAAKPIGLVLVPMTVLVCITGIYMLVRLQQAGDREQRVDLENVLRSLEAHTTMTLRLAELSMRSFASTTTTPAQVLSDLQNAPYLRSISTVGGNGTINRSSNPANIGRSMASTDFFPRTAGVAVPLRVGVPVPGRDFSSPAGGARKPLTGMNYLPVIHEGWDASAQPVTVVAALNPDDFLTEFSAQNAPAQMTAYLLRYDGTQLLGSSETPFTPELRTRLLAALETQDAGLIDDDRPGRAIRYAYRASRSYPVVLVIAIDRTSSLARWRHEISTSVVVVVALLLAIAWAIGIRSVLAWQRLQSEYDTDAIWLQAAKGPFDVWEGEISTAGAPADEPRQWLRLTAVKDQTGTTLHHEARYLDVKKGRPSAAVEGAER